MKNIKKICCGLFTVCLLAFCLNGLTDLVERKGSDFKYDSFFSEEGNFDVLFFGTSHVINGIFPMELWKDCGITSYNFGGHANAIPTSYWVMENALDHTDPKVVVLDCLGLGSETKTSTGFDMVHLSLDAFPLTVTKCRGVWDLLQDKKMQELAAEGSVQYAKQRTKMSLLWDFSIYHSRWNELSASDFNGSKSREKGAESRIAVSAPGEIPHVAPGKIYEGESVSVSYVRRLIESCKSRGIEVLLTYLPYPAGEGAQLEARRILELAKEYDVQGINFLEMDIVDYNTDCYDPGSHLNPSGARKVTDYLGKYLTKTYDLPDRRKEDAYQSWQEDYEDYERFKDENLRNQSALDVYLMLLADKNYDCLIEVRNPILFQNPYYMRLLNNLGIQKSRVGKQTDCFVVHGGGSRVECLTRFSKRKGVRKFSLGKIWNIPRENGGRGVYLNGESLYEVAPEHADGDDVHITVFDGSSGEKVDQVGFSVQGKKDAGKDLEEDSVTVTATFR